MSAVAHADRVQTSVPPRADATVAFSGRVTHKAHAATELDRAGLTHPVVVVELDHVGPARQRLKANVPCESHEQAAALAESLKRGAHVTVSAAVSQIRLFLGGATLSIDQEPA